MHRRPGCQQPPEWLGDTVQHPSEQSWPPGIIAWTCSTAALGEPARTSVVPGFFFCRALHLVWVGCAEVRELIEQIGVRLKPVRRDLPLGNER